MYFDAAVWVTNIIESWYQTLASIYYSNSSKHTAQWSACVFTCPGFDDADWPLSTNNDLFCDVVYRAHILTFPQIERSSMHWCLFRPLNGDFDVDLRCCLKGGGIHHSCLNLSTKTIDKEVITKALMSSNQIPFLVEAISYNEYFSSLVFKPNATFFFINFLNLFSLGHLVWIAIICCVILLLRVQNFWAPCRGRLLTSIIREARQALWLLDHHRLIIF